MAENTAMNRSLINLSDVYSNQSVSDVPVWNFGWQFTNPVYRTIVGIAFSVICPVGIFGNTLVILSVLFSRKLQTISNVFVVNLAVADLMTCIFGIPGTVAQLLSPLGVQRGPDWFCVLIPAVNHSCIGVSVLTLASISLTRARIVSRPLEARFPTSLMAIWLTFIWLIPYVVDVGPHFIWEEKILGYSYKYGICAQRSSHPMIEFYNAVAFLVTFPIPLIIIIRSFYVIVTSMKRHSKNLVNGSMARKNGRAPTATTHRSSAESFVAVSVAIEDSTTRRRLQRRQIVITKNMMVVVGVFFICIGPYTVGVVLPDTAPVLPLLSILIYFNNCLNPFIYAKHPNFRVAYSHILNGRLSAFPDKTRLLDSLTKSSLYSKDSRGSSKSNESSSDM